MTLEKALALWFDSCEENEKRNVVAECQKTHYNLIETIGDEREFVNFIAGYVDYDALLEEFHLPDTEEGEELAE